ncbi:hypothetical protein BDV29DRAFT_46932 [Aspergillus leporis]|uniref:Uncharacterized protein n=1 Tax=Aspergillus leporis TaxID=41062 RepID=A0A5N5WM55_9EURO|nr:hypothetical protein BDV29DRAFT_46932 [Aspergillus leporis]
MFFMNHLLQKILDHRKTACLYALGQSLLMKKWYHQLSIITGNYLERTQMIWFRYAEANITRPCATNVSVGTLNLRLVEVVKILQSG